MFFNVHKNQVTFSSLDVQQNSSVTRPLELLMELEAFEQENSSLKVRLCSVPPASITARCACPVNCCIRSILQARLPLSVAFLKRWSFFAVEWPSWSGRFG
jgi:hypothetical protein